MPQRAHPYIRLLFAALALVFFLTPLAINAAGSRTQHFENRRLEPAPKLADGWNAFDVATRYLIDRLPLRDQAVHANTWIDEHLFHTTPVYGQNGLGGVGADQALPFSGQPAQDKAAVNGVTPPNATTAGQVTTGKAPAVPPDTSVQVTAGTDGWFYLQTVLQRACTPFIPFSSAVAEWEKLVNVIRASGRHVVFTVAPDKSTIYPEYLPAADPYRACGQRGSDLLWDQLESPAAKQDGVIGLRQPMLEAKRTSKILLYYKTDSHWNQAGALTMTEAALPAFSSTIRVQPSEIDDTGTIPFAGDLLALLGQHGIETAPTLAIHRQPGAPTVPTPTLLLGDSYEDAVVPQMQPYFPHLTALNWNTVNRQQEAAAIIANRNVILETVERELDYRATSFGFVSPSFVAYIQKALAGHKLP
jgi:alginate O-acetyltransferase complex protein AlgJ